jgi:hypothetical protein
MFSSAANNNRHSTGEERALSGNSPVISEPVLVNPHKNGAAPANGKTENVNVPSDRDRQQNQIIVESETSGPGQLGEDQAAVKAQAAFRGYLVILLFQQLF